MEDNKQWYTSKGVWGGVVSTVCAGLALAGKSVDAETQLFLTDSVYQIVLAAGAVVGGLVAVWGRLTAKSSIGSTK